MIRRALLTVSVTLGLLGTVLGPTSAGAVATQQVRSSVATTLSNGMPLVRLRFASNVTASNLPPLSITPPLTTQWQQIGPREVQAISPQRLQPLVAYRIEVPSSVNCASSGCRFTSLRAYVAYESTDFAWEQQLLATLHYLPLTFTPTVPSSDPAAPTPGVFTWTFPSLPARLSAQWQFGQDNVLLTGALMAFQNDHQLPTTGIADAATWNALLSAVDANQVDTHPYDYVDVTTTQPEHLDLYVNGHRTFQTLVNTGISVDPTQLGTFPVYLRYVSQTMSGTNPNGTHYSDPGIPWVSYFNGGDALHGFIRASYGFPQSVGCVEMPFASASRVWPLTPIGTLVTVQ